jgi:hypothetical protein
LRAGGDEGAFAEEFLHDKEGFSENIRDKAGAAQKISAEESAEPSQTPKTGRRFRSSIPMALAGLCFRPVAGKPGRKSKS